tara:strand:+ start:696 stop:1610 length:915 start_codon:yes stop_codon:yes gene_type:complete
MLKLNIQNETGSLIAVVVGIADDFGGTPDLELCYDPKSKAHVVSGKFPKQEDLLLEMQSFISILEKYNIKVYRPSNIQGINQIFARDIAFVIEDKIFMPNIIVNRQKEIHALEFLLNEIDDKKIIYMPKDSRAEGGDVLVCNEHIFVGYSELEDFERYTVARTNSAAIEFLSKQFPDKKVKGFELKKSDKDPRENALHLDCCFQPIGNNMAILYKDGFKNDQDVTFLMDYFGRSNIIEISKEEMYNMNSNIFSISDNIIVSERGFVRLNNLLRSKGFVVEEIPYFETAKMEGLLRCSTLPLIRE